jgi:hypothetical protein
MPGHGLVRSKMIKALFVLRILLGSIINFVELAHEQTDIVLSVGLYSIASLLKRCLGITVILHHEH